MKSSALIVIVVLMSLIGLAQSPADSPKTPASVATMEKRPAVVATDPGYTIGPEDVVNIAVWKEPDFTTTIPVRPDGKISVPLIGDVQASGKTPEVLAAELTTLLKKYVEQPRVTVMVTAVNSRRVFLLGEIIRPGPIVMTPGMTVLQAIAAGGGPSPYANTKKIYVLRNERGSQSKYPFNYKEAIKGNVGSENILLIPGDTIVVP